VRGTSEQALLGQLARDIGEALTRPSDDAFVAAIARGMIDGIRQRLPVTAVASLPPGSLGALIADWALPENWKAPLRRFIAGLLPSLVGCWGGVAVPQAAAIGLVTACVAALCAILDTAVRIDGTDRDVLVMVMALNSIGESPSVADLARLIPITDPSAVGVEERVRRLVSHGLILATDAGLQANV